MNTKTETQLPMTKTWSQIVARYEEQPNSDYSVAGVAELARHIQASELSLGLFGWTSMFDLCITQTEVWHPYHGPYLRVRPLFDGQIEFRYLDTPDESTQWHRTVPAADAIRRLDLFLDQLHWCSVRRSNDA